MMMDARCAMGDQRRGVRFGNDGQGDFLETCQGRCVSGRPGPGPGIGPLARANLVWDA